MVLNLERAVKIDTFPGEVINGNSVVFAGTGRISPDQLLGRIFHREVKKSKTSSIALK